LLLTGDGQQMRQSAPLPLLQDAIYCPAGSIAAGLETAEVRRLRREAADAAKPMVLLIRPD
jgi:hypothetical protein